MLEAAGITILSKAVDFLFEEGRKVLEERRERRQAQGEEPAKALEKPPAAAVPAVKVLETKEEMLHERVNQAVWEAREKEVQHLMSLMNIYYRNYRIAQEQYAKWGSALVPPIIVNNMEEAERDLIQTMKKLEKALSDIYSKPVELPGLSQA